MPRFMMSAAQYFGAGRLISGGHPRPDPEGYPYDLDSSQRYTRFADFFNTFPYPYLIGGVHTSLPLYDAWSVSQAVREKGLSGPWMGGATWAGGNPLGTALQPVAWSKVRG